jgi:hypothetical protein
VTRTGVASSQSKRLQPHIVDRDEDGGLAVLGVLIDEGPRTRFSRSTVE